MKGSLIHAAVTAAAQIVVWFLTGNPLIGGAVLVAFWIGNEFAQAEYRAIGDSNRASIEWYAGLKPKNWTKKGRLDVLLPLAVTVLLGAIL